MRKILFRGKSVEDEIWIDGFYVCLNAKEHRIYSGHAETDCGDYYPDFWTVDPETVGQFTGLTDKNGVKIFEGDILKYQINIKKTIIGKISFICGAFVFESEELARECDMSFSTFADDEIALPRNCIEVVGNIHDI